VSHYFKLAFTTFRIVSTIVIIYSLLSFGYSLMVTRPASIGAAIAALLPNFFYLLFGVLLFVLSKWLAKLTVSGVDRE
jgi:hypothetical protein